MPTITLRGMHISYERAGEAGTPVVLIMGFGMLNGALFWVLAVWRNADLSRSSAPNRAGGDASAPGQPVETSH